MKFVVFLSFITFIICFDFTFPVVVLSLSHIRLFSTPWTATYQAPLSFTTSQSLLKPVSIESMMPSNYLNLCHPLLLLPSVFPNIRVLSNELVLYIRWPKYWSLSFRISLSNEYSPFFLRRTLIPSWSSILMPSSRPHHLPKTWPPVTIMLRISVSHMNFFLGGTHSVHRDCTLTFYVLWQVEEERA